MVSVGIILELVERRRNKLFDGDVLSKGLFLSAYRGAYHFFDKRPADLSTDDAE